MGQCILGDSRLPLLRCFERCDWQSGRSSHPSSRHQCTPADTKCKTWKPGNCIKVTNSTWHSKAALFHCISCLHLHTPSSPSWDLKHSALMSPFWQKESLKQAVPSISNSKRVPFFSPTSGETHSPQSWIMSGSSHWHMPHSQVVFSGHPE